MSSDSLRSSKSQSPLQQQQTADKAFSYVQLICSFCKFKKRKCNGENPCSTCKKHNQTCVYFADNDRRRRKYHTDYINYLENKSDVLTKFISEFVKDSPELNEAFHEKLSQVIQVSQIKAEDKNDKSDTTSAKDASKLDDHLLEMLDEASKLNLDEQDHNRVNNSKSLLNHSNEYDDIDLQHQSSPYSELTSSTTYDAVADEESNPLTMNGLNIVFRDESFRNHLINSFEEHFSVYLHCFKMILPSVREWEFSSPVPSKQLLMCSIFAVGAVYSPHPFALSSRKLFIAELEYIAINACRYPLDIYLLLGLSLLSMYELGMGNDSISYLFNSMACSLTQHMGLHISYDQTGDSKSVNYAPKASPIRSSILWGICVQDRIITSICNVQCCIHFKRIIAPPYQTILGPESKDYLPELSFAYQTRLWYIFDRFMDQICSENGDIGDTQQRTKLLEAALNSLSEFKNSLPSLLVMNSNENNNKFTLILHYTYYTLICHYHKAFIKITKNSTQQLIQNSVILASILSKLQKSYSFETLPYNATYLIYSNALIYLIVISKNKDTIHATQRDENYYNSFKSHFQMCLHLLKALSKIWKRPRREFTILKTLCSQSGVYFQEFEDDNVKLEASESHHIFHTPEAQQDQFSKTANQMPFFTSPENSSTTASDLGAESFFRSTAPQPTFFDPPRSSPSQTEEQVPSPHTIFQQQQQQQQPIPPLQAPQPLQQPLPGFQQPPVFANQFSSMFQQFPMGANGAATNDGFMELVNQFYPNQFPAFTSSFNPHMVPPNNIPAGTTSSTISTPTNITGSSGANNSPIPDIQFGTDANGNIPYNTHFNNNNNNNNNNNFM